MVALPTGTNNTALVVSVSFVLILLVLGVFFFCLCYLSRPYGREGGTCGSEGGRRGPQG